MIESISNAGVKLVVGLNAKSKLRKKENAFVVEGPRMVFETPKNLLKRVYISENFPLSMEEESQLKEYKDQGVLVETVTEKIMKTMSDTVTPQGILAVVEKPVYKLKDVMGEVPLLLVLETIQDPGNLGTMFRTAEGAGVTGIIMTKDTVDVFSPKVVRSTMGSLYRMPFVITESLQSTILLLKEEGLSFYAAHLEGKRTYDSFDYKKPSGFLIGNEGNGLTDEMTELADEKLIIPMEGKLESLNAAMASGILMYEAARQRRS
ncbi:MAG: RNA methyltransferase [Lachnospiraceae bacterium]|nr:RNA methyltransferase [Lachnospiraceae bacterium]